jgi:flagellar biosynthesis regulator FlaF
MSNILANNSIYNSNISGAMNLIERKQATSNSIYGFVNQFDDLRFDNISTPTTINESHTTLTGINTSLQRNLDFHNNYSQFQNTDMHFDVVSKDEFVHNNMTPRTSYRDFDVNADRTSRKLENFTGAFEYYKPKKEAPHLFEPMKDLSFVNGMPTITNAVQNRYLPSNKNNNGNLPFQTNVKIIPGVDNQNQLGAHSVYRILPKNVDHLRSDINQKITYESKPLEVIKKGEFRGVDPYLTKFKMPDFREIKVTDFVSSKAAVDAPKQTGPFTNVQTMRNEQEHYILNPPVNTNRGKRQGTDTTRFEPAKKENYINDNARSVSTNYNKPVMTNVKSFSNYNNQRTTTNSEYIAPVKKTESNSYVIDYKDIPLTTIRQLMINNDNILGARTEQSTYVFSNDMVLPITNRQINNTTDILGPSNTVKMGSIYNNDQAKTTQRPSTNYNNVLNTTKEIKNGIIHNNDQAKLTQRPSTNYNNVLNTTKEIKNGIIHNNDQAKLTQRPSTNYNNVLNTTKEIKNGIIHNNDQAKLTQRPSTNYNNVLNTTKEIKNGIIHNNDQAKITQRPSTNYNNVLNTTKEIKNGIIYNNDQAKPTIKQTTLIPTNSTMISNPNTQSYIRDIKDKAKNTHREQTEHAVFIGAANSNIESNYVRDLLDKAKKTHRENMVNTQYIGHVSSLNDNTYVKDYSDIAKATIRQQLEDTQYVGHINSQANESTYMKDYNDIAKATIRQQLEDTKYVGHINSHANESTYSKNYNDIAKPTIKQTTLLPTPGGRVANINAGNYTNITDEMKTTIKQTTFLENYKGVAHGEIEQKISHQAANNMSCDDRREISTYNRGANGKGDDYGPYIDENNVRLNEPILYSHVPNPHKNLDYSVMPSTIIDKNIRPVIESSSYYINPNFINTLKDNPLVNDMFHQKNI